MSIIEEIVSARMIEVLSEIEDLSQEIAEELDRKNNSHAVADLTTEGLPSATNIRILKLHMEVNLLKGLI